MENDNEVISLPFTDYYRAKLNISTPLGTILEGGLGYMSQFGDVIRFEGISASGDSIVITAVANEVRKRPDAFETIDMNNSLLEGEK